MTLEEFDKAKWYCGIPVSYKGDETYEVLAVNFDERLVCLGRSVDPEDSENWVRCENVTIL